ncbi:hypothetical protein [Pueribacillus sp. YX66]|uniref:hypothetical protein n=1 Tax=Pueribacillus sp. YX66 TaxID=3229242 RepID=UPI00358D4D75
MPRQEHQSITEQDLERYFKLSERKKEIEKKMKELNQSFHLYFDETAGENQKGEIYIGQYKLQRQIRKSNYFDDAKTVKRLEELNLHDCIQVIKKPDQKKIESAITLGIIEEEQINDCKHFKNTKAIIVKKV